MSKLRESVIVKTPTGDLLGELFVGADGLPEILVGRGGERPINGVFHGEVERYRPATFPAAWRLEADRHYGLVFEAWVMIERIRDELRYAQCEAEQEARREPDCIDAYKRDAEARGER